MYTGIGTTVVALMGVGNSVLIAHAGDSRCYRLRDHRLELLTEDHSLLNDYIKHKPDITAEELAAIPRMVITRALGMRDLCDIDLRLEERRPGDVFLLCTDGLHNALTDREIERVMGSMVNLTQGCQKLIDEANAAGGPDNIGVVLARW
jgi:PPM family protein phosphatase